MNASVSTAVEEETLSDAISRPFEEARIFPISVNDVVLCRGPPLVIGPRGQAWCEVSPDQVANGPSHIRMIEVSKTSTLFFTAHTRVGSTSIRRRKLKQVSDTRMTTSSITRREFVAHHRRVIFSGRAEKSYRSFITVLILKSDGAPALTASFPAMQRSRIP